MTRFWLLSAAVASALLVLALSSLTVTAHTPPARTAPEAGSVLDRPPTTVDIWFPLDLDASKPAHMAVTHNPSGRRVDRGGEHPLDAADPTHMRVTLQPDLGPGHYVVTWEATDIDGHPAYPTSFAFTVAAPATAENDERIPMMLAVFGAAAFATTVGSIGFLFRRQLGLVKPPPEQPPSHH